MHLTDDEIRDLAMFLARRVTPDGQRPDPTDAPAAGRTPALEWQDRLVAARSTGRLSGLVQQAAAAAPDDRALQEACTLFARAPSVPSPGSRLAIGASVAIGFVALAACSTVGVRYALEAPAPVSADTISAVRFHPSQTIEPPSPDGSEASVTATLADTDAATGSGNVGPDALAPRVAPGLPAQGVATRVPRVEDGPPEEPLERSACSGWFYVGVHEPEASLVVDRRTHVRVVHPSRENGWDRKSRIVCILSPGDEVRLAGVPVELPGGHWWAPIGAAGAVASAD